jgi:hypothetical protein
VATSGTTSFNLDVDEVIREAMETLGGEPVLGNELRSARRSLNLLLTEWQNRGILLWKLTEQIVTMVSGTASYTLTSATLDIKDAVITRSSIDLGMTRLSFSEYLQIPNKYQTGRPMQYFVDRQRGAPVLYVWPVPENSTDQVKFWRIKKVDDITKSAEDVDVPWRFYPALVTGLAYLMSLKRPGIPPTRRADLKAAYDEQLRLAFDEDRERVSLRLVPHIKSV